MGIIVDGSTQNTELTINPLGQPQKKGFAHSFAYGESTRGHVLNIGQITINSGQIGAIEGFQDTELSGPLVANGTAAIDRIAFDVDFARRVDHDRRRREHARRARTAST